MIDTVCCIHNTFVEEKQVIIEISISKSNGPNFSSTMRIDFLKSTTQINNDIKSRVAFLLSTSSYPTTANDVMLCGGFI